MRSLLNGCVRRPNEKGRFFPFNIVDFVLILLGHALGFDRYHHDALLIFRANVLKHAKTEGFFKQCELRKTDTAREVCVGMAAQITVVVEDTAAECSRLLIIIDNRVICSERQIIDYNR